MKWTAQWIPGAFLAGILLTGCIEPEETTFAPAQQLSSTEGAYSILILMEGSVPASERSKISDQVIGTAKDKGILDEAVIAEPAKYEGIAAGDDPVVLIMDTKEVVLQTTDIDEASAFLAEQ